MRKKSVLIAGGSGLVGSRLTKKLLDKGYEVRWLSRSKKQGSVPTFQWDTDKGHIDEDAFSGVNAIINLAGAGIADARWTGSRKKLLIESRTKTAALLDKYITQLGLSLDIYINASAVGFYGDRGTDLMTEEDKAGTGFLAECCQAWESAAEKVQGDFPKAILRIGIVLSTKGGALEKMLLPLKMRTNTYFGDGDQYMSWIHIDDMCGIIAHLIDHPHSGIYNCVASHPLPNKVLVDEVAKGVGVKAIKVPAPAFALRLAMGEMADVVLESTRVSNSKVRQTGFTFEFQNVTNAVRNLLEYGI